MDYYSIIVKSKNENNTKYLNKLEDFDKVKGQIDKLIKERKTFYINNFHNGLCVDMMYFEKGKRIY